MKACTRPKLKPLFSFSGPCVLRDSPPPLPLSEILRMKRRGPEEKADFDVILLEEIKRFAQLDKTLLEQGGEEDEEDPLVHYTEEELRSMGRVS